MFAVRSRIALAAVALSALAFGIAGSPAPAQAAPANERWTFTNDSGYRCEMNTAGNLGKGVCRNPRDFNDYYVMYFDFDERTRMVFIDGIQPAGPGRYTVTQEQITFAEWQRRYGR